MKLFLISDNVDTQTGLRLSGIEGVVVHEMDDLQAALETVVADKSIGILLITEKLARLFPDFMKEIKLTYEKPLIVEIPDRHGTGRAKDFITSYVTEAIGLKL